MTHSVMMRRLEMWRTLLQRQRKMENRHVRLLNETIILAPRHLIFDQVRKLFREEKTECHPGRPRQLAAPLSPFRSKG
ncbi:hypothetical protein N7509_009399 [Penicillium cosmopolitanum]|uniref:Uncharacterized protein n=1 Tax=Penicillium cosmopolitanum TaxID=1131564 RepID=A0A9W9VPB5_9EURO|nr:uncharacterized protein N7509_009399 [Penicillium cosmopolitanum]KAJ5386858.1 hypothetical protein N7509_009399 [Penicillium cosmopolitanum]